MDWRRELHAELALGAGLNRLTAMERNSIAKGRSFETMFNGATDVRPLPWRLPGAQCEIAFVEGDPNPWCRCTATMPASMQAVLEGILEIDGEPMRYTERAVFQVHSRPTVHTLSLSFTARIVPMMPPMKWSLCATWAAATTAEMQNEYTVVFLPEPTAGISDAHDVSTLQLMVLKRGQHASESHFTYLFQINFGRHTAIVQRLLPNALMNMLTQMRELVAHMQRHYLRTFWRSQLRAELALEGGLDRLTADERARIHEGLSFETIFEGAANVQPLPWRLPGGNCEIAYVDGDPNPWCRCTITLPGAMEAVLEGIWELDGKAMRYHEDVEYRVLDHPSAHSVNWVFRARIVQFLPMFAWGLSGTWAQMNVGGQKELTIVFLPGVQSSLASKSNRHSHAASTRQLIVLKLGARAKTTRLTYLFQLDLGAGVHALERVLPNARVEAIRRQRESVASIKKYFEKQIQAWLNDVEDDSAWRNEMVEEIRSCGVHACSEEQSALIAQGVDTLDAFAKAKGRARSLKLSTTVKSARARRDNKTGRLIGDVECDVHGATPEDIVAFLMHFDSKIHMSQLSHEVMHHETLEVKTLQHTVVRSVVKTALESRSHTVLHALLWEKVSDSPLTYTWVAVPIKEHHEVPPHDARAARAEVTRCCRLTQLEGGKTKVECAFEADGIRHLTELMRMPLDIQSYFLKIKPASGFTTDDGVLLGHLLMDLAKATMGTEQASAIRMFVERTATLRECGFAHLDAMFHSMFDEHLLYQLGLGLRKFKTVHVPEVVAIDPAMMTAAGAASIGRGLESILRMSANPADAIDDLVSKYPALGVMARRHVWFRPMMQTIAKRRMMAAPLGLKLRLTIGAVLSIGDVASDINNIVSMLLAANRLGAFVLICTIALNLAVQALVVTLQNAHRGWREVFWELSIVFSFLKPGIDAMRVASGEERIEGAPIDPFTEMVICKCSELTFESIPGGLAQAIFLFQGGGWTAAAVGSVSISCLSTAFIVTMLAYDFDTDAARRNHTPKFYGYIPDGSGKRIVAFALLFLYHSVWTFGKTFSMVLLAQTNSVWLVAFLLTDHCGFIFYKLVRGDLSYWVPGLGFPLSALCRFAVKVVVDFTGERTLTGLCISVAHDRPCVRACASR